MLCPQEGEPPVAQDEPISLYQNMLLTWGNLLYEESQLAAATGCDWRPILDAATARFREAGCNEPDIVGKSSPPHPRSPAGGSAALEGCGRGCHARLWRPHCCTALRMRIMGSFNELLGVRPGCKHSQPITTSTGGHTGRVAAL